MFFGEIDEHGRRDHPLDRMLPARQSLDADQGPEPEADLGLIHDKQFFVVYGRAQFLDGREFVRSLGWRMRYRTGGDIGQQPCKVFHGEGFAERAQHMQPFFSGDLPPDLRIWGSNPPIRMIDAGLRLSARKRMSSTPSILGIDRSRTMTLKSFE